MYSLLIVEDEIEIREGIKNHLESEMGIFKIMTAKNGNKALEIVLSEKVDAMILDIRMPVMDGITLLSELKKRGITITSVILSGYDEFEYAKTALEYGVQKYILKPVTPEQILATAKELEEILDIKEEQSLEVTHLKEQVIQNMQLLKERFFNDLVRDKISQEAFESKVDFLKLIIKHTYFQVAVIDVAIEFIGTLEEQEISKQKTDNIIMKTLEGVESYNIFYLGSEQVVILYDIEDAINPQNIIANLIKIKNDVENAIGTVVTIGVGNVYAGIGNIKKSYFEAANSIKHRVILGNGSIICHWNINAFNKGLDIEFNVEEFKLNLKMCMSEEAKASVERVFDLLSKNNSKVSLDMVYACSNLILAAIASVLSENGKSWADCGDSSQLIQPSKSSGDSSQLIQPSKSGGDSSQLIKPGKSNGDSSQLIQPGKSSGDSSQLIQPGKSNGDSSQLIQPGKSCGDSSQLSHNPFTDIFYFKSIASMRVWILELLDKTLQLLSETREGKCRNTIEKVKKIIVENYAVDITSKYISDILFLNQDYLGRIFKIETGYTVSDYLNKVRIQRAKELLREGKFMVYEVAERVGFQDQHYFSAVFKKITGITPSQFKEV